MTRRRSILCIAREQYELETVRVTEPETFSPLSRIVTGMAMEYPTAREDPRQAS